MYKKGNSYSAINTAKSALMTLVSVNNSKNWVNDQDLNRFFKGLYNLKPPIPKYTHTWDVEKLLNYIELLTPLGKLTLKEITMKTLGLIAITSGNRAQSIHLMNLGNMIKQEDCFIFLLGTRTKTTKQGTAQQHFEIRKFSNANCCVYTTLEEYLRRTDAIRKSPHLWVSLVKPHKAIGRQTLSRWLKDLLKLAGIDTSVFTAHSTRMASTSKAKAMGVGIHTIIKTAGWKSDTNFRKFYLRDTDNDTERLQFAEAVLASHHQ